MRVGEIRDDLIAARVPRASKINISTVLGRSGHLVDASSGFSNRLWSLTDSGRAFVRNLLKLPDANKGVTTDVGVLNRVISKISDKAARDYIEEAVECLKVEAFRATVVFVWSGAVRVLQTQMLSRDLKSLNAALIKHYPKAKSVHNIEDFAYIKDSITLLAAKDLGILDKNQKDTLEEALNLRNRSGHPGNYRPGEKKVSGFIEDIVSILFM